MYLIPVLPKFSCTCYRQRGGPSGGDGVEGRKGRGAGIGGKEANRKLDFDGGGARVYFTRVNGRAVRNRSTGRM
jgi:hypothetical protein